MSLRKVTQTALSKRLKLLQPACRSYWPWASDPSRILVLFLPWLDSKEKHIRKYTDVYSKLGLDVLCMKSHITDFLWPPYSLRAGGELAQTLEDQCKGYDQLCFHSMSVGAYNMFSFRMMVDERHSNLSDKICGFIFDSIIVGAGKGGVIQGTGEVEDPTDALDLMVRGIARTMSDNKLLFSALNPFMRMYFTLTKSKTLDFYMKSLDVVRDHPLKVPTLFMASKDDPMSDYKVMLQLADIWNKRYTVPVQVQLWDKSKHAQHIVIHRDEYLKVQREFLSKIFQKS